MAVNVRVPKFTMKLGTPRVRQPSEMRVALTPPTIAPLIADGHEVIADTGTGAMAHVPDESTAGTQNQLIKQQSVHAAMQAPALTEAHATAATSQPASA